MKTALRSRNNVDMLQILRGFAAFLVFQGHVFIFGLPGPEDSAILQNVILNALLQGAPWVGTWIFFTLSGYLIGKGFYTERYDFSPKSIILFWKNRAIRIIPLYYFALFIAIVLVHPEGLKPENWRYVIKPFLFNYDAEQLPYNPNGTLWFVSTLVQFYIVAPIIFFPLRKIRKRRQALFAASIIIIISFCLRLIPPFIMDIEGIWSYWGKFVYKPVYNNLDLFLIGFLVNVFVAEVKYSGRIIVLRPLAFVALPALWILSSLWAVYFISMHDPIYSITFVLICPVLTSILTAIYLVIHEVSQKTDKLSFESIRRNPIRMFEVLGKLSFGFYIWHALILETIRPVFHTTDYVGDYKLRFIWGGMLSLCLSAITYFTIEKPAAKLKSRINSKTV